MIEILESSNSKVTTDVGTGREYHEYKCTVCKEWFVHDDIVWVEHNPYCIDHVPDEGEVD